MQIIALFGIFLIGVICTLITRNNEKKKYNKGICPQCSTEMTRVDCYNGNREYICDGCGYKIECAFKVEKDYWWEAILNKIMTVPLFLGCFIFQIIFGIISPISFLITKAYFYYKEKEIYKFNWSWYKEIISIFNPYTRLYFKGGKA